MKEIKKDIKRFFRTHPNIKSATDTFLTTFLITFLPLIGSVSWDKAAILGAVAVALRAGIKALNAFLVEDKTDDYKKSK